MRNQTPSVHPTAIVEAGAEIGRDVTIEPYAVVKEGVVLGDCVTVRSHAYIDGLTTIGENTVVYPGAVIGTKTQDRKFRGEETFVRIGKSCEIRECVTINSSSTEGSTVSVGDHCLIMAYCHVAHDCTVGNNVIMANGATLAGHVTVGSYAVIGGKTAVHQFTRIGEYAMVGAMSRAFHDMPPYMLGGGDPYRLGGINVVGLKRHGFSLKTRQYLFQAFRLLYRSRLHVAEALVRIEEEVGEDPEVKKLLAFCRSSKRGLIGLTQEKKCDAEEEATCPDPDSGVRASP